MSNSGVSKMSGIRKMLAALPRTVAQTTATKVAVALSDMTQAAYDSGSTVYDTARPTGAKGALDLVDTGAARNGIGFIAVDTIVRSAMTVRYAKYLVGKYKIMPVGVLPSAWQERIRAIFEEEVANALRIE